MSTPLITISDKNINSSAQGLVGRIKGMNRLFLFTVVLPALLSGMYFGLIASDIYISESRFVVCSPQCQGSTGLGALFQGAGFSRSQDDIERSDDIYGRYQ